MAHMRLIRRFAAAVAIVFLALTAACGGSSSSKTATPPEGPGTLPSATQSNVGAATSAPRAGTAAATPPASAASPSSAMTLSSDAFASNATIPTQYTCSGASTQPPLKWSGAPSGTNAFALLMEDTDVPGIFDHWVVYDLPASVTSLDAQPSSSGDISGGKQGKTSRGSVGYVGPCPPPGSSPHHYRFRIYSLDAPTTLPVRASKSDVLSAMQGHILAQGELVGLFSR